MKEDDLRIQAWDFFRMQASQRLTTFNFYIAISSLLSTGMAASFKTDINIPYLGVTFGLLLILFSVIFWKLDQRNRDLIKGAEATLKFFEANVRLEDDGDVPHIAKRFTREEFDTENRKKQRSWRFWLNHYSYSECLLAVFVIFGMVGVVGSIWSLLYLMSQCRN